MPAAPAIAAAGSRNSTAALGAYSARASRPAADPVLNTRSGVAVVSPRA
ncbi:MAG TPA: hypothetical protein VMU51_33135 [Mycobacteriales bacterium]|nr:hypothetical protein [Mycobacteriales bacterium]